MSIFIPETLGKEQLLELEEASRRSTVHFDAVCERLSTAGKEAKRRISERMSTLSATKRDAERQSKLSKGDNT